MENKKGVSGIISIILIIALLLVVVGIVWLVIQNVVTEGTEELDFATKCLGTELEVTAVTCGETNSTNCDVVVKKTKGDEIGGVKVVLTDEDGNSQVTGSAGDISVLATKSIDSSYSDFEDEPTKVESTIYFIKENGDEYICSNSHEFKGVIG